MPGPAADDDDTVIIPRAPSPHIRRMLAGLIVAVLAAAFGGAAWQFLWKPPARVDEEQRAPFRTIATEADIREHRADALSISRFALNPRVLVLDFPTLLEQGRMLNRVAAFIEKKDTPRDRVLDDAELDAAIRKSGSTTETFYYGHDYRAADLARFFATAGRDGVRLNPEEERLRQLVREEGWFEAQAVGALISLPREGVDAIVDAAGRGVILHHELSHGEYFTNAAYAEYARQFWATVLNDNERAHFRHFLEAQNYDPGIEDVMVNETQAYLMHTPNERFFSARDVELSLARLNLLRAAFLAGMPAGWLRDCTPAPGSAPRPRLRVRASPACSPGSRWRRRQRRGCAPPRSPRASRGDSRRPAAHRPVARRTAAVLPTPRQ
jgi:hypothetical protein